MIEKTHEEFLPGEFIAVFCRSIDGVVYLKTVYQVESVLIENGTTRNLNVVELSFGSRPEVHNNVWNFPLVRVHADGSTSPWKVKKDVISSYNTQLRQQLTEEEVLALYRADLSQFGVHGVLHI